MLLYQSPNLKDHVAVSHYYINKKTESVPYKKNRISILPDGPFCLIILISSRIYALEYML